MKKTVTCFILLLFISCSSPTDSDWYKHALSAEALNEKLILTNNTNKILYLFIVEREMAALINWVPHFGEPKVMKYGSEIIDFSEIVGTVKSGDEVIIYFWDDSNMSGTEVYSMLITI